MTHSHQSSSEDGLTTDEIVPSSGSEVEALGDSAPDGAKVDGDQAQPVDPSPKENAEPEAVQHEDPGEESCVDNIGSGHGPC